MSGVTFSDLLAEIGMKSPLVSDSSQSSFDTSGNRCVNMTPFLNHSMTPHTAMLLHAQCYCPYTHCASGVAIVTADGRVCSGGYVESAAYNPGLPPFQAAVVAAIVGGMPSYDQVPCQ